MPLIKKSIEQLGFKYSDTKIILISHAHGDHDEATGVIKKETGAKLMVMDADVPEEESTAPGRPGAHVDRVLHDGETVELGGSKLVAHLTPGHTRGCTTWTMQVRDGARTLNAVIVGSPNVNPGYILVGNKNYPQIADDYVKTFAVLKSLPCDLFLGAHGGYFGLKAKYEKMKAGVEGCIHRSRWVQSLRRRARRYVPQRVGAAEAKPGLRRTVTEPRPSGSRRQISSFAVLSPKLSC